MSLIWSLPTWALLFMILFGGGLAALGVTLYPAASSREDKARLAHAPHEALWRVSEPSTPCPPRYLWVWGTY
jgi:hypothetical protein